MTNELVLTRRGAARLLRTAPAGARFFVSARVDLPIAETDKYFLTVAGVAVSRNAALRFVENALSEELERRGGRIAIRVSSYESVTLQRTYYHIG